jgi:predicted O-methyltransferase YrrM
MALDSYPPGRSILALLLLERHRKIRAGFVEKRGRRQVLKPYMKYREIIIIEEVLTNLQPTRCLEWGSGFSTVYFPYLLKPDAHWLAIEHVEDWAKEINRLNMHPNVEAVFVPPNAYPWSDVHDDGSYSDLVDYVEIPKGSAPYDFILVDGRARKDCLMRAYDWIAHDGVVVLHDAKRPYYHEPLKIFPHQVFFIHQAYRDKGLWLGSKGAPIEDYLDVATHQRLWSFHNHLWETKRSIKSVLRK